ncbi:response regulator [archaeon]|nr:MAG: response regulator [archaeon]
MVSFMVGIDNALETLFNVKQICDLSDCKCASNQSILHLLSSVELCIGNCKRTNQFMLMVINRMMDSAKSARGLKLSPKYETISLLDTIKLPLECVRNLKSDVPIVLEKIPDEICRYIITDKQWLQENLLALLTNAVKYSNGGTVVLRVLLECFKGSSKSSHQYIRFEVEDEGIGMTNEASESLFNPFQQNQRLAGGTGLGLFSLSKRTEALKGQCGVQKRSDEKQGSLFWFTIQYRPDESHLSSGSSRGENLGDLQSMLESPDRDSTSDNDHFEGLSKYSEQPQSLYEINRMSSNSTSLPTLSSISLPGESETTAVAPFDGSLDIVSSMSDDKTGLKRPRVLLVDDTTSILKMTTMMLKMHDFDVTAAMNGAAALDIVEESCKKVAHLQQSLEVPFDVVLMDLQMPIMDGIEATKRLRRWEMEGITSRGVVVNQQKRLKIIGLSANSDDEVLEETKKAGFDGFIPKPFNVKSLRPFLD